MRSLMPRSPTARCSQLISVPPKASPKKMAVSMIDAAQEPISGACHQARLRSRLKTETSRSCDTMNAVPEASAMRTGASNAELPSPTANPTHAIRRAACGPWIRLQTSDTKYATGYENAPQVSHALSGNCTSQFDASTMPAIATAGTRICLKVIVPASIARRARSAGAGCRSQFQAAPAFDHPKKQPYSSLDTTASAALSERKVGSAVYDSHLPEALIQ